jgi:kynurenine formamidase
MSAQVSAAEFRSMHERLRASVPWGPADRRGALNYIKPEMVIEAAGQIRLGRHVSLAAEIEHLPGPDNQDPARHQMLSPAGAEASPAGLAFAYDRFAMNIHGDADTHLDALCHVIFDGTLYNALAPDAVTQAGAQELAVDTAHAGLVGRGVLLDIPRTRGVRWLEPGHHVTAEDLTAAEAAQGVRVGEGDLLFVRVGHRRRKREFGAWDAAAARAGLHPEAMQFVADRRVALLGSDGNSDCAPSVVAGVDFPVHALAINALGLQLLDYLDFGDPVQACERASRWTFFAVIAPLRLPAATGSPVNPIAIL